MYKYKHKAKRDFERAAMLFSMLIRVEDQEKFIIHQLAQEYPPVII